MKDWRLHQTATDALITAGEAMSLAPENHIVILIRNSDNNIICHSNLTSALDRIGILRTQTVYEEAWLTKQILEES